MIETKRKKQEMLDRISGIERTIREKNKSRDITMFSVKESQRESQERMQKAHDDLMTLEEEIYDKGCRLETLEHENERFEQVSDPLLVPRSNSFSSLDDQLSSISNESLHSLLRTIPRGHSRSRREQPPSPR